MLAGIEFGANDPIDELFGAVARDLAPSGRAIAGYVQFRSKGDDGLSHVFVRNLRTGIEQPITKSRGKFATGCKLDGDALTRFGQQLITDIDHPYDLLIIARFGKSEAEGNGLRDVISHALNAPKPILVGVRDEYANAWQDFHGDLAAALPFDHGQVADWVKQHLGAPSV
ncbi:DUF2478 domain-containing protein [Thalassospira sp. MA62]|nr:DUF2478 domain-containing protein [Thalassospira sp. MA62]